MKKFIARWSKWPKLLRYSTAVILALLIILPLWGVAEIRYQMHVKNLSDEATRIDQVAIKPLGGVLRDSSTTCPHFADSIGIEVVYQCPAIVRNWFVLVEGTDEGRIVLMDNIAQLAGYAHAKSDGQTGGGAKNNITLDLEISPLDDEHPPYPAPTGKEWIILTAEVLDLWNPQ